MTGRRLKLFSIAGKSGAGRIAIAAALMVAALIALAAPAVANQTATADKAAMALEIDKGAISFNFGTEPTRLDAFPLSDGIRLVVDAEGVQLGQEQFIGQYPDGPVAKVVIRQTGDRVRAVVEARSQGLFEGYSVEKSGEGFKVLSAQIAPGTGPVDQAMAKATPAKVVEPEPVKVAKAQPAPAPAPVEDTPLQMVEAEPIADPIAKPVPVVAAAKASTATGGGEVTEFGFHQDPDRSYVDLVLSKMAQYEVAEALDTRLVIDIKDTKLPKTYQRALDTSAFQGPVRLAAAYGRGPHVRLVIDLKQPAPFKIEEVENGLAIAFEGGSGPAVQESVAPIEKEKLVLVSPEAQAGTTTTTATVEDEVAEASVTIEGMPAPEVKGNYKGQRISMDFVEADIRNVLRIIGEIANINIVTGSEVVGKISIRLIDVPWDHALDVILKAMGLDKELEGNVMRVVAAERIAEEKAQKMAEKARMLEEEQAAIKAKEESTPLESDIFPVNYATADEVMDSVKTVISERGSVTVDERTNTILIHDLPENIEMARQLVARLDTPTPQVLIEARIVEVSSSYAKDLGIQWGGSYVADAAHGNSTGYGFPSSIGIGGDTGLGNYAVNLPSAGGSDGGPGGALALSLGSINDVLSLDLRLSALEAAGRGRVVSSPRVTTLDNKTAEISQGIEIPFTTATEEKIETSSINYLLMLKVTPHVTSDNSILLQIDVDKDAPSTTFFATDGTPAIETRRATTEVLVRNGDTTVIGGIITDTTSDVQLGIPWFREIPFIGWMFKSKINRVDKTELIIFITPRIVQLSNASSRM